MPGTAARDRATPRRLGPFAGVFTPAVLTILGVIIYLRRGWVVGKVGLLGASVPFVRDLGEENALA